MYNPLDAEINLSNITLVVAEVGSDFGPIEEFVEVEVIKEVTLAPKESISVSNISLQSFVIH